MVVGERSYENRVRTCEHFFSKCQPRHIGGQRLQGRKLDDSVYKKLQLSPYGANNFDEGLLTFKGTDAGEGDSEGISLWQASPGFCTACRYA